MAKEQVAGEAAARKPTRFAPPSRNLVVCCDGTSNEIGKQLSNVMKLYRVAEKSERQLVYYNPGIGTLRMPDSWHRRRQKLGSAMEMATGYGLDRDVLETYCFLCRNYRDGDDIYLFGFSRGAYTVRVLAGLIYLIGLLRDHQVNFAAYALRAYKTASTAENLEAALTFNRVVTGQQVPIRFLGVWDTVSSVIVPGRNAFAGFDLEELPYTSENPAVQEFRQAIAIDEFRRMFRIKRWTEPQRFKPNFYSQEKVPRSQTSRQVWFAGCHADIGGGFDEEESALSKIPLLWMVDEACLAPRKHRRRGLFVRPAMVNRLVKGHAHKGMRRYTAPDPTGPLHLSLTAGWKFLEWLPKHANSSMWPGKKVIFRHYLPRGEPRYIPEGSLIHQSVVDRLRLVPDYKPTNLPKSFLIEPSGLLGSTVPGSPRPPFLKRFSRAAGKALQSLIPWKPK